MAAPNTNKNAKHIVILILITILIYAVFKFVIKPLKDKQFEDEESKTESVE